MKRVLLVSPVGSGATALGELLKAEGYACTDAACSAYGAAQKTESGEYDLILINAPLPDETGIELSLRLAKTTRAGVVVIVPQKNADEVSDMLTDHGVLVIAKPLNKHLFHHYLCFIDCFRTRLLSVVRENEELKTMVEDIKMIDRAKLLLVTCLGMSEEQAHRYLEKQAMDQRLSRLEIAKQVIRTYQN